MDKLKKVLKEFYDQQAEDSVKKVQIIGGGPHDGATGSVVSVRGVAVEVRLDSGKMVVVTKNQIKEVK